MSARTCTCRVALFNICSLSPTHKHPASFILCSVSFSEAKAFLRPAEYIRISDSLFECVFVDIQIVKSLFYPHNMIILLH